MVSSVDDLVEKRAELETVLGSREFLRAPALAKLLRYLCEKTFSGQTVEIKEFSIATEVFGRANDYGEKRDSLVRVEVHRLRKKLERFYETEGAAHTVRILIRPGNYQPEFERALDGHQDTHQETGPPAAGESIPESSAEVPSQPAALTMAAPVSGFPRITAPWKKAALAAALLAVVAAAAVIVIRAVRTDLPGPAAKTPQSRKLQVPVAITPHPVRILAGSNMDRLTDRFGSEWDGDRYFTGGSQDSLRFGNQERSVPHPLIAGAADQTPFHSFRSGAFSYRIPLAPGKYELRLYFSEVFFGITETGEGAENRRVFDVVMNGQPLLTYYDIFASAGATNTADIRVFEDVSPASDEFLTLDFRPVREVAWLNAIELIPNATGHAAPLRIVARPEDYVDGHNRVWSSDRYFLGGREASDGKVPSGTSDPELLFASHRYGHFSYRLPVPPGKYMLRLFFTEPFFGPDNRGKGGVGSRVFDVYSGGTMLLRQFDIFREAGENRAIEKVFHGLEPNAQGRIDITFEPIVNYAVVKAIELVAEVR